MGDVTKRFKPSHIETVGDLDGSEPNMGIIKIGDVPNWLRGSSVFQIDGAENLFNAMRDDAEQKTTHRIRECLFNIGLEPLVKDHHIRFLLKISRGNDLAFLWFLMELHYKSNTNYWTPNRVYNMNEQIIMTIISHLDMVTTLRELDKILPPGHEALWKIKKRRLANNLKLRSYLKTMKENNVKTLKNSGNQIVSDDEDNVKSVIPKRSPYFAKIGMRENYGKPLFAERPRVKAQIDTQSYDNPNYFAANENNRWYSSYEVHPGRRVAYRVINQVLKDIMSENYNADKSHQVKNKTILIARHDTRNLCLYHRVEADLQEFKRHQRIFEMYQKCIVFLDFDAPKRKRSKILLKELDEEIQRYEAKLSHIKNLKSGIFLKIENDQDNVEKITDMKKTKSDLEKLVKANCCDVPQISKMNANPLKMHDFAYLLTSNNETIDFSKRHIGNGDSNNNDRTNNGFLGKKSKMLSTEKLNTKPTVSQDYYTMPTEHKPYKFDYNKIFKYKADGFDLKRKFLEALKNFESLDDYDEDDQIDDIIRKVFKKLFSKAVKIKNEQQQKFRVPRTPLDKFREKYNQKYYDCDDTDLLNQMLKDALCIMSKNPKFVLASLPDAHKIPKLREWIYQRYGKTYTWKEMAAAYTTSKKMFRIIDKLPLTIHTPDNNKIGKNLFANYDMRNYLLKKTKFIKNDFYMRLETLALELTRTYWFAFLPFVSPRGEPRQTFFAYLPATSAQIHQFRVWKTDTYTDTRHFSDH